MFVPWKALMFIHLPFGVSKFTMSLGEEIMVTQGEVVPSKSSSCIVSRLPPHELEKQSFRRVDCETVQQSLSSVVDVLLFCQWFPTMYTYGAPSSSSQAW